MDEIEESVDVTIKKATRRKTRSIKEVISIWPRYWNLLLNWNATLYVSINIFATYSTSLI